MPGPAGTSVGLAHPVAKHGSWHLVRVWVGQSAVTESRTAVGGGIAIVALSVEDHLHDNSIGGVRLTTGLHESFDGALLFEGVGHLRGPLVAAETFGVGREENVRFACASGDDVSVANSWSRGADDIVDELGPLFNIASTSILEWTTVWVELHCEDVFIG